MNATPSGSSVARAKRLVVKVGSSLVTADGRGVDHAAVGRWAEEIAALKAAGKEIALVSSGAIAEGMQRLGWARRPAAIHALQAAAAVGQMGLVQAYETAFSHFGLHTAQILLTHDDLSDRRRYLNARSTLLTLLGLRVYEALLMARVITDQQLDTLTASRAPRERGALPHARRERAGLCDLHARRAGQALCRDRRVLA